MGAAHWATSAVRALELHSSVLALEKPLQNQADQQHRQGSY